MNNDIYHFLPLKFQEYVIKKSNRMELMAMLGLFGAVISGIQMYPCEENNDPSTVVSLSSLHFQPPPRSTGISTLLVLNNLYRSILERSELHSIKWNAGAVSPLSIFTLSDSVRLVELFLDKRFPRFY
jgi:hypothetical protein